MFINWPDPIEHAERLLAAPVFPGDDDARRKFIEAHRFTFERAMRKLEHETMMALAIALDETASAIERQNAGLRTNITVTPDDMRRAAQQLRERATLIESGEEPKPRKPPHDIGSGAAGLVEREPGEVMP